MSVERHHERKAWDVSRFALVVALRARVSRYALSSANPPVLRFPPLSRVWSTFLPEQRLVIEPK